MSNLKVGDIVKIPQNALLSKDLLRRYRRIDKPTIGFITEVNVNSWPTVYHVLIGNETWEAIESDLYALE